MTKLTHYIELRAIPQAEIPHHQVMAYAMQYLHRIFPQYQGDIGIAFPQYDEKRGLGHIIRLFSQSSILELVEMQLNEIGQYFLMMPITPTPEKTQAVCYQRIQHKSASALRRAECRLKQQGKWNETIMQIMQMKQQQQKRYPHVFLKSYTTQQDKFILEIKQLICKQHQFGKFNSYGLSSTATIPHF